MKKLYRLLKADEFKNVLDKKKCIVKNNSFSFYYAKNNSTHIRIGISVSNKIGNAVVRVRIRRQIRAMITLVDKEIGVYNLLDDVVIICRKGFNDSSFKNNYLSLLSAFNSLLAMKEKI